MNALKTIIAKINKSVPEIINTTRLFQSLMLIFIGFIIGVGIVFHFFYSAKIGYRPPFFSKTYSEAMFQIGVNFLFILLCLFFSTCFIINTWKKLSNLPYLSILYQSFDTESNGITPKQLSYTSSMLICTIICSSYILKEDNRPWPLFIVCTLLLCAVCYLLLRSHNKISGQPNNSLEWEHSFLNLNRCYPIIKYLILSILYCIKSFLVFTLVICTSYVMFVLLISGSQDHFRGEMEQISLLFIIPMMLIIITSGTFNKKQISNKYSTAIYSLIAVIIYGYISVTYGVGNSIIEKSLAQSHISRKNAELTLNFNACGPFIQDNYPIYHTSASACTVKEVNIIHHEKGDKYVIDYTRSDGSIRRIDIDEKYVFTSSKAISPSLSR